MAVTDRPDARVERTVAKVLDAVHRLLKAEGLGSATFGRVSRETGVSRTTLYRHWSSPSELIVRDVVESATMRRSLPALLMAAQRDLVISSVHAQFVHDRRQPIVARLELAVAESQIAPDADPELLVDLIRDGRCEAVADLTTLRR